MVCNLPRVLYSWLSDKGPCLGTVLTIHQDTKLDFTNPITERLRQRDTGLRTTADASLLVESLLDLGMCTRVSCSSHVNSYSC